MWVRYIILYKPEGYKAGIHLYMFSSVQLLSCVQLFATPWTAACQASLSITNSQSILKLMSIESVMPSNHLILCWPFPSCLQSFPASGSFSISWLLALGSQSIGASASASVLPTHIQGWFPLGLTVPSTEATTPKSPLALELWGPAFSRSTRHVLGKTQLKVWTPSAPRSTPILWEDTADFPVMAAPLGHRSLNHSASIR